MTETAKRRVISAIASFDQSPRVEYFIYGSAFGGAVMALLLRWLS